MAVFILSLVSEIFAATDYFLMLTKKYLPAKDFMSHLEKLNNSTEAINYKAMLEDDAKQFHLIRASKSVDTGIREIPREQYESGYQQFLKDNNIDVIDANK